MTTPITRQLKLGTLALAAVLACLLGPSAAHAAPTDAQKCEAAVELASAKYAQCRLTAESKDSKVPDAAKRTAALVKCSQKLTATFSNATAKYGASCPAIEPASEFDAYLTQCSDDTAAAAAGAALPDYVAELSACNGDLAACDGDLATCDADLSSCDADLATCGGDLATCSSDLATAEGDLATCEGDLAACEASSSTAVLKTGQTTSYGAGTDGAVQAGVARNYVDNGDGTITDTRTGLMWAKKSDDGTIHDKDNTYAWSTSGSLADGPAFTTYLATLNAGGGFAGHTDWRLPNEFELFTLQNFGTSNPSVSAAFDTACGGGCTVLTCSCTSALVGYWSSTSNASNGGFAWVVGFSQGHVTFGQKIVASSTVRAVRVP